MKTFVIFWENKVTGLTGNGTALYTEEDAKRIVEDMNLRFPYITHWYQSISE